MAQSKKRTIGRNDKVDLPEFDLYELSAKVDTGASLSAIHCHRIRKVKKDGVLQLKFNLLDPLHPKYNEQVFYAHKFELRTIKNSFGNSEKRYVIKTKIHVFGKEMVIEFSLSNRGNLRFPILLGRRFISGKYIVDVTKVNLSYKESKK